MAYSFRKASHQEILYNDTNDENPLEFTFIDDTGTEQTPTSATIAIYSPSQISTATPILAATAMTVSGSKLTYVRDTSTSTSVYAIDQDYRAKVIVTYSSATYERKFYFDIVRNILKPLLTENLLKEKVPSLMKESYGEEESFVPAFNGAWRTILERINDYNIQNQQIRASMVLDSTAILPVHENLVIAYIYENKKDFDTGSIYRGRYEEELARLLASIRWNTADELNITEGSDQVIAQTRFIL